MDIFWFMQILIVLVSICTICLEIRKMAKLGFHLLTFLVVLVLMFWVVYYSYQLIRELFALSLPSHRTFVRSGILMSVSLFLAKAIRVNRSIK